MRTLTLVVLLAAPALAQPKAPPPLEDAKRAARREIEKWYEGREVAKLYDVVKKSRDVFTVIANRKKLAKVTWDMTPAVAREGVDSDEWLASLAPEGRAQMTWGTHGERIELPLARWKLTDLRLTRENVVTSATIRSAFAGHEKGKLVSAESSRDITEPLVWIRQGGDLLLDRRLDGSPLSAASEELYDEPWFGGSKSIGHVARRIASIDADERVTQLERKKLREEVGKELEGLIAADAGSVAEVTGDGCVILRSGRHEVLAWPADKAALEQLRLRKGDWVVVRGRVRVARWGEAGVGRRVEIDQAELKPQP